MKLIVGLGNPGNEYLATRHNAGWIVLERIGSRLKASEFHESLGGECGESPQLL